MLVMLVGPAFLAPTLTPVAVGETVSQVTSEEATERFERYPALRRCLQEKCAAWASPPAPAWVDWLCRGLIDDPDRLGQDLTLWALLAIYPARLLEYVLSPQKCLAVRGVPLAAVSDLALNPVAVEQAKAQISLFFDDIGSDIGEEQFRKLVACTSGRLSYEFDRLVAILQQDRFSVSAGDIELVRSRFSACDGLSRARLASLDVFVTTPPPAAADPDGKWGVSEWVDWVTGQYLPFRHSQVRRGKSAPAVEQSVCRFSDWYVREYASIHQNADLSLVHVMNKWADLIRDDSLSVVAIVDCLPASFWPLVRRVLTQAGFHQHEVGFRFSPLPSDTANAKRRLLTGTWQQDSVGYPDLVERRGKSDWSAKEAVYLPDLKALATFAPPPSGAVVFLNFLPIDELLHSDTESAGGTYEEGLHRLLTRLSEGIRDLVARWAGPSDRMGLYVVTDHGACRILEEEQESFDSKVASKLFSNEKHRFAYVPDKEAQSVPDNLWALGYRFKQPFVQEEGVYFIPRGHSTVRTGQRGAHFVHGGASPEEIIVPAAVFRPVKTTWKEPSVRFLDLRFDSEGKATFYVLRVTALRVEVANPNSEAMILTQSEMLTPEGDIKEFTRLEIPGHSTGVADVSVYFQKAAQERDELALQFTYKLAGEEHSFSMNTGARFKTAVSGGFSLRDLA